MELADRHDPGYETSGALDRITRFMQAWDNGTPIATAVSHQEGQQALQWTDLAEARLALAARHDNRPPAGAE